MHCRGSKPISHFGRGSVYIGPGVSDERDLVERQFKGQIVIMRVVSDLVDVAAATPDS